MACYHPLKAFELRPKTATQKAKLKIVPYFLPEGHETNLLYIDSRGQWQYSNCNIPPKGCQTFFTKWFAIPCGKCIGCRLMYSKQWATRLMLESQYHESSYFVTMTYNPDCVPISWHADSETGEASQAYTLRKDDFQKFMKRLRKNTGQDIRFFAAGEYGSKTFRPHYHAILFGLKLSDLELYKQTKDGWLYYTSPTIQKAWSVPKRGRNRKNEIASPIGMCLLTQVNWSTCAYVARYVCKKGLSSEDKEKLDCLYETHNIEPPFSLMSRKPGIAHQWFVDHPEYKNFDTIPLPGVDAGKRVKPPRYFDYLLEMEDPAFVEREKTVRRNVAEVTKLLQVEESGLDYESLLNVQERSQLDRMKKLPRNFDEGGEF